MPSDPLVLSSVEIEGFISYKSRAVLELHRGACAITGPNGDGKSTIASKAISWCFFGKCAPERMGSNTQALKGADIVNDDSTEARVSIALQQVSRHYRITRTRGRKGGEKVVVEVDGAPDPSATPESVLGVDYEVFTRTVLRGQNDPWNFAEATDARKREIIDIVSGAGAYEPSFVRAKELAKAAGDEASRTRQLVASLDRQLAGLPDLPAQQAQAESWEIGHKAFVLKTEGQLAEAEVAAQRAADERSRLSLAAAALPADYLKPWQDAWHAAGDVHIKAMQAHDRVWHKINDRSQLQIGQPCPICGEIVHNRVMQEGADLVRLKAEVDRLKAELDDRHREMGQAQAYKAAEDQKHRGMAGQIQSADAAVRAAQTTHRAHWETLQRAKGETNPHTTGIEALQAQRNQIDRDLAVQRATLQGAERELAMAEEWVKVLAPKGVRAHVGDAVIGLIEAEANRWLSVLSGGKMMVSIRPTRETAKATKEEITVQVISTVGATTRPRDLLQLSGGQKARVNLAIDLGVAAAFGGGGQLAISLLVLDEATMANLDAQGKQAVVEAINQAGVRDVLVVDHDPALIGVFPRTLRVQRGADGWSEIVEVAGGGR